MIMLFLGELGGLFLEDGGGHVIFSLIKGDILSASSVSDHFRRVTQRYLQPGSFVIDS